MLFLCFYDIILIEWKGIIMKQKHKYIILILLFIVLVASITFTYLYIHYKDQGTGEFIKRYSEIKYSNINVNNESDLLILPYYALYQLN